MPKEKWLIDPSELDEFQKTIYDLDVNDSYIIKGGAGSGKTLLALYRAQDVKIRAEIDGELPSFIVIVFTKTLSSFIKSAIINLGIDIRQVLHFEKWDKDNIDYIIADECQDFTKEQVDEMFMAQQKSIMFYGDSHQQVYEEGLTLEQIAEQTSLPIKELERNYRLPKTIAEFVYHLGTDINLRDKCMNPGFEKPRIIEYKNWQEELDFIIAEINSRRYDDVAVLLPFNNKSSARYTNEEIRNVENVISYFDSKRFRYEAKLKDSNNRNIDNLDFDSELPKVMTFHGSKGLQFETVFIPFCDYPIPGEWLDKHVKKPLYVALTRTCKNLYITHSGNITEYFNKIPSYKFDR
jgi:superfamily I DNA/RNA helicase